MRQITEKKAIQLLKEGHILKCKITARDIVPVKTESELRILLKLKAENVQMCEIFFEREKVRIPENAMEISLDDAIELVAKGEIVYGKKEDEEEEITTQAVLTQYYRSALLRGEPVLYWYI